MSALFRVAQLTRVFNTARTSPRHSLISRALSTHPADRKYTKSHEWAKVDDGVATVGISSHAQSELGDIVFVELPEVGSDAEKGKHAVTVESVKASASVYAPINGEVVEVNEGLSDAPELINSDPYSEGWLFKVKVSNASELDELMPSSEYETSLGDK